MKGFYRLSYLALCLVLCLSLLSCGLLAPDDTTDDKTGGLWDTLLYKVTFVLQNGSDNVMVNVSSGSRISRPPNPQKEGHLFDDWYIDEALTTPYDFSQAVTKDITLYAGYYTDYAALTNRVTQDIVPATITVLATNTKRVSLAQTVSITSTGSGVLFQKEGTRYYLLTNYHVTSLREGYTTVSYAIEDYCGNEIAATLVAAAEEYDLALLYFDCDTEYPTLNLAETNPAIGDEVICIGHPKGQDNAITYGTLLELKEVQVDGSGVTFPVYYHTAPLATGSSGGALLSLDFEIVGINFAVATDKNSGAFMYGLTIPAEQVQTFLATYWKH